MLFFMITGEAPPPALVIAPAVDERLLQRIGENDLAAFEQLYLLTERTVYAFVLSILRDPDDTCDIVQETYLKIRASAHLYHPQGKPLAWMFTIAKNLSLSLLRQRGARGFVEWTPEDDARFATICDPTDRLVLLAALDILNEEERSILLLHAVSGVRHREIAQALGLPLSTVLSRYQRSLKKLKRHLAAQEGGFR